MIARRRDRALAVAVAAAARAGKELFQVTKPIPAAPAGETTAALRERRQALLEQIDAADAATAEARAGYETAFTAFASDESSEELAKELWLSHQRIQVRERRQADLAAQLEATDGAISVAERGELEQRMAAIDTELADNRRVIELNAAATAMAARLVDAMIEIRNHNVAREALRSEQQGIRERLGLPLSPAYFRGVDASLLSATVGLRDLARDERDPVRRGYLESLALSQIEFRSATLNVEGA
jgi:hypothetical protein